MATVIGVDASNFACKQYYGDREHDAGQCMLAKFNGARMLFPDAVIYLAFDTKPPTFRHELYPEYKGNRRWNPDDRKKIHDALDYVKFHSRNAGLIVVEAPGHEADDVLASLARQCRMRRETVHLVSEDRDFYTLLMYDGIRLWKFIESKGIRGYGLEVILTGETTESDIVKKFDVECWQWIDFRCMCGDSSDNIKGLNGYGPKRSRLILQSFDSLDKMYSNWDEFRAWFSDEDANKLDQFRKELPTLRRLFRMVDNLDVIRH